MNQAYLVRTTQASFLLSPHPLSLRTNVETISPLQGNLPLPSQTAGTKRQMEQVPWLCLQALPLMCSRHFLPPS